MPLTSQRLGDASLVHFSDKSLYSEYVKSSQEATIRTILLKTMLLKGRYMNIRKHIKTSYIICNQVIKWGMVHYPFPSARKASVTERERSHASPWVCTVGLCLRTCRLLSLPISLHWRSPLPCAQRMGGEASEGLPRDHSKGS